MESGRAQPWAADELGERYGGMLQRIIGFRATVTSLSGKFKLGQDENPGTLASILDSMPDADTVTWMRRFNEGRGGRSEEHTSELQSLMRISYAVFCLKKKTHKQSKLQKVMQISYRLQSVKK